MATNITNNHIQKGCIACCRPKSQYQCAVATGKFWTTIPRVLQGETLHSFHAPIVLLLQPCDHPRRITFGQWFVQQSVAGMHFGKSTFFNDEATLSCKGVFNKQKAYMWILNNQYSTRLRAAQQRFTNDMWASVVGSRLLVHSAYNFDWTLISISFIYSRYSRSKKKKHPYLF